MKVNANPHKSDGVTRRGRGTRDEEILELRASLKWALGYLLWSDVNGVIEKVKSGHLKHPGGRITILGTLHSKWAKLIARALRRTDAAAYKRGHADCHSFHEKNSQERR